MHLRKQPSDIWIPAASIVPQTDPQWIDDFSRQGQILQPGIGFNVNDLDVHQLSDDANRHGAHGAEAVDMGRLFL